MRFDCHRLNPVTYYCIQDFCFGFVIKNIYSLLQAMDSSKCVGAIVCKLDIHRKVVKRGYIAMLAVDEKYRKKKIGKNKVE